jgi:hypothetical protein
MVLAVFSGIDVRLALIGALSPTRTIQMKQKGTKETKGGQKWGFQRLATL